MIMLQPEHQEIQFPKYRAYTGIVYQSFEKLLQIHPEVSVDHPDFNPGKTYHVVYDDDREVMV